jgi:hypothetical protein
MSQPGRSIFFGKRITDGGVISRFGSYPKSGTRAAFPYNSNKFAANMGGVCYKNEAK